jgi:hypothetical protein
LSNIPCDAQDDIFGLGVTMILTGKEPLAELESAEVEARFLSATFPATSDLSSMRRYSLVGGVVPLSSKYALSWRTAFEN